MWVDFYPVLVSFGLVWCVFGLYSVCVGFVFGLCSFGDRLVSVFV